MLLEENHQRLALGGGTSAATRRRKATGDEYLTLEHLLLVLTREPKTQKILVACGANVKRLRQRLEKFLADGDQPARVTVTAPVPTRKACASSHRDHCGLPALVPQS